MLLSESQHIRERTEQAHIHAIVARSRLQVAIAVRRGQVHGELV